MSILNIEIKSFEHLLFKRQEILSNNMLPVGVPDAVTYFYVKEATFFSKKEETTSFYLFQGLNTNPQNLSIFMRDQSIRENKSNKDKKLNKGIFTIYDIFTKTDCVIEINIPGNLRIFKIINSKKELISNDEIDMVYISSILRSMYEINLPWGRYYNIFQDNKDILNQFQIFMRTFLKVIVKVEVNLGNQFENKANIKGSHACSLVFAFILDKRIIRQALEIIEESMNKHIEIRQCPKINILLAELYSQFEKTSKSLEIISKLLERYEKDPFLLYYQSKYLLKLNFYEESLLISNAIVQYNQFEVWTLLAEIHMELKHYGDAVICLNHAVKLIKFKTQKHLDVVFKPFQQLGKIKLASASIEPLEYFPKLMITSPNPLSISIKEVQEKYQFLCSMPFWKLNPFEKNVFTICQNIKSKVDLKRFQELLSNTFEEQIQKYQTFNIKKGMTESMFIDQSINNKVNSQKQINQTINTKQKITFSEVEELPHFLQDEVSEIQNSTVIRNNRNLSIIVEIQSVIENSNYEEKEKERFKYKAKLKREINESFYKILTIIASENEFEKAEQENNIAKILPIYNKMRSCSRINNYFVARMFEIFKDSSNYRSIVVLIAETLDFLEQKGVKKIEKLPYWMQKYVFFIIEEKGLKFLNDLIQKLNFYDEALLDTIEIAKSWKIKGITY